MADVVLASDMARGAPAPSREGNAEFVLPGFADARTVFVAGDFNRWDGWAARLERRGDRWVGRVRLAPGTYGYKFVVDDLDWVRDPGDPHSVLVVPSGR